METSLGNYLRQERLARGITLSEVASTTRVSQLTLRFIEDDRYEDLPAEVYVRGYLRAYAQCIGLDPEEVIARRNRPINTADPSLLPKGKLKLGKRYFSPPALLMVLVWLAMIIAFMTISTIGQSAR